MTSTKPVHTVVLDTGAIIRNHPTVSSLIAQSENIVTVPAIISEIRDAATRSRVETTLQPFLTLRSPSPNSIKVVTDFARRTGDLTVLSKPDILIIALTYELECERNGGDWRLRKVPGQKGLNGAPPVRKEVDQQPEAESVVADASTATDLGETLHVEAGTLPEIEPTSMGPSGADGQSVETVTESLSSTNITNDVQTETKVDSAQNSQADAPSSDSEAESDGWITPSNLKKHQEKDASGSVKETGTTKTMQVAVLTTDYAMQNVILQMNLNLLSPAMQRIKYLKTFVLRCHACFQTVKQMDKQFCPRCGGPTLTRVACSTNANGEFKLHLKQNMQWNHRGDRFSIPKLAPGSAHGRVQGGGKGGWGNELMLAEDQKEYMRAVGQEKKTKHRDLMDEDYLPSILTGDRAKTGGRIKVGAGRNVNSKKR